MQTGPFFHLHVFTVQNAPPKPRSPHGHAKPLQPPGSPQMASRSNCLGSRAGVIYSYGQLSPYWVISSMDTNPRSALPSQIHIQPIQTYPVGSEFYIRSGNCTGKPLWPWPFCFACKAAILNEGLWRMAVRHCFWADSGLLLDERLHNPKGLPKLEAELINRDWNKNYYEFR